MKVNVDAHWRDSARSVRFFIWDGQAAFPMVFFLMHIRIWTFVLAVVTMMFFTIIKRYGFSPIVFLRWLRSAISGRRKMVIPWWME